MAATCSFRSPSASHARCFNTVVCIAHSFVACCRRHAFRPLDRARVPRPCPCRSPLSFTCPKSFPQPTRYLRIRTAHTTRGCLGSSASLQPSSVATCHARSYATCSFVAAPGVCSYLSYYRTSSKHSAWEDPLVRLREGIRPSPCFIPGFQVPVQVQHVKQPSHSVHLASQASAAVIPPPSASPPLTPSSSAASPATAPPAVALPLAVTAAPPLPLHQQLSSPLLHEAR